MYDKMVLKFVDVCLRSYHVSGLGGEWGEAGDGLGGCSQNLERRNWTRDPQDDDRSSRNQPPNHCVVRLRN